jgi:hypothetical protein
MENPAFIGVGLSDVRTIVAIIHVLVEEFTMSGGDGTHSNTRVSIDSCAWTPSVTSCMDRAHVLFF